MRKWLTSFSQALLPVCLLATGALPATAQQLVSAFETSEGYPAAPAAFTGTPVNSATASIPFTQVQGWTASSSTTNGYLVTTTSSGSYTGGQALASAGGTPGVLQSYIGARNLSLNGIVNMTFDVSVNSVGTSPQVTLSGWYDANADGMFNQTAETAVAGGILANGQFGIRGNNFGTAYGSGVTPVLGNWYRLTLWFDFANNTAMLDVFNLTTGQTVDLNGATAGNTFVATAANLFGATPVNPASYKGIVTRVSGSALLDNIRVPGAPLVSATVNPSSGFPGDLITVTANVTPTFGVVTNVTVDLSPMGGSAAAKLFLQGANVYTNTFTVGSAVSGPVNFTVTVADDTPLFGIQKIPFEVLSNDRTWDGGSVTGDNWSDAVNWVGNTAPPLGANNFIFAGTTRLTPDMNNNYGAGSVTFDGTAGSFVLGSSGGFVLTLVGGIANNSANPQTLNLSIANAGNTTTLSGSANITVGGGISGAGGLTSANTAAVILSGTNEFTGGMSINAGTLQIAGAGRLGGTNGTYAGNITNSGALLYSSSATQTLSGVVSWYGNVIKTGSGKLILAGNNTYFADTHISNGVLQVTGTLANDNGNNYVYSITDNGTLQWSSSAAQILSGVISGSGGLVKDGSGTLTMNAANTYSGPTVVSGGTLAYNLSLVTYPTVNALTINAGGTVAVTAGGFSSLPVGNLTLNSNSVLRLNYDFSSGNPTVAAIAVSGSLSTPSTNIIRISGFGAAVGQFPLISYTGTAPANLNNYALTVPPGVTANLVNNTANKTIDLNVTASSPSTWISLIANDAGGTSSFTNSANWANGLVPTPGNGYSTGPYLLRSPADVNDYTFAGSALSVDQYGFTATVGRFLLKGPGNATITVNNLILNGGLLDYADGVGNTTRTLAGNILLNGGTLSYLGALVNEALLIAAPVSGTGNLQIGGANVNGGSDTGIVALNGANSYSGSTTIATGRLLVNGTAPNTSVTVLTNATLGGTGSVGGVVVVQPGGTLTAGNRAYGALTNTIGTLTAGGAVTVSGTVLIKLNRDVAPNADKIVAPSLTLNPDAVLTVINIGATNLAAGDTFTLFSTPVSGSFSVTNLPALPSASLAWVNKLAVDGTLSVTNIGGGPSGPALLSSSYNAGVLSLSWPAGEGWRLQAQTNDLATGLSSNWAYVTDGSVNSTNITPNPNNGTVFYRLTYP